eukprot:7273735-Prymnesium_polylepis.2
MGFEGVPVSTESAHVGVGGLPALEHVASGHITARDAVVFLGEACCGAPRHVKECHTIVSVMFLEPGAAPRVLVRDRAHHIQTAAKERHGEVLHAFSHSEARQQQLWILPPHPVDAVAHVHAGGSVYNPREEADQSFGLALLLHSH